VNEFLFSVKSVTNSRFSAIFSHSKEIADVRSKIAQVALIMLFQIFSEQTH
jgi:hypothetical protein